MFYRMVLIVNHSLSQLVTHWKALWILVCLLTSMKTKTLSDQYSTDICFHDEQHELTMRPFRIVMNIHLDFTMPEKLEKACSLILCTSLPWSHVSRIVVGNCLGKSVDYLPGLENVSLYQQQFYLYKFPKHASYSHAGIFYSLVLVTTEKF